MRRAGFQIDVRIDASLADQLEIRQLFDKFAVNFGTFPDENENFGISQSLRKPVVVLEVIIPDRHLMGLQLGETVEFSNGVEVVIENSDIHLAIS